MVKKKVFLIFLFLVFIMFLSYLFFYVPIPSINDVFLTEDPTLKAGYKESCITPALEIGCQEGLECKLISTYPFKNGICLKPTDEIPEDLTNRPDALRNWT